eukprot:818176_1
MSTKNPKTTKRKLIKEETATAPPKKRQKIAKETSPKVSANKNKNTKKKQERSLDDTIADLQNYKEQTEAENKALKAELEKQIEANMELQKELKKCKRQIDNLEEERDDLLQRLEEVDCDTGGGCGCG